jgi:2-hydroxyacyl-CoA lyase 1
VVFGKGAAYSRCEAELRAFVDQSGIPFLATPMGKGVLPDKHPLNAAAARSLVLKGADVVVVVGARLNWILHFGEAPRWGTDTKFILLDVVADGTPSPSRLHLTGDAKATLSSLNSLLASQPIKIDPKGEWVSSIKAKVEKNAASMAAKLAKVTVPLDYHTTYAVILRHLASLSPSPIVVSEGANTMDIGRSLIEIQEPRTRLDAGTWGTMGVGLGYAVAAAVTSPDRVVFAIEGDSAFGFSGMEVETLCRYKLRVIVLIFNNNGIYGGKWESEGAFPKDPTPTAFVPDARYEKMAEAFGGLGFFVATPQELDDAIKKAIASNGPAVINIDIDPLCGVESGSLQDHN